MVYGSLSRVTKRSAEDIPGGGGGQPPVRPGKSRAEHRGGRGAGTEAAPRRAPGRDGDAAGSGETGGGAAPQPPRPGPAGQGGGGEGGGHRDSRGDPGTFPRRGSEVLVRRKKRQKK